MFAGYKFRKENNAGCGMYAENKGVECDNPYTESTDSGKVLPGNKDFLKIYR